MRLSVLFVRICDCVESVGSLEFLGNLNLSFVIIRPHLPTLFPDYQFFVFSMLSFVYECTAEVIRTTQRSPLFPNSNRPEPNREAGLSWFHEGHFGHRNIMHVMILYEEEQLTNKKIIFRKLHQTGKRDLCRPAKSRLKLLMQCTILKEHIQTQ